MESADATNITSDPTKRALDAIERRFALKKESEQHNKRIRERSLRQKENNDGARDSGQGSSEANTQSKKGNFSFFPNSSFQGCHKVSDEQNQHPTYHKLSENVHENLIKIDTNTPSKVGAVNEILHDLLRNGDFSQNYMKGSKGMKIDNWFSLYNIVPNQVTAMGARVKVLQNHSKRSKNHMSMKQHKKHGSFDFPQEFRKSVFLSSMLYIFGLFLCHHDPSHTHQTFNASIIYLYGVYLYNCCCNLTNGCK